MKTWSKPELIVLVRGKPEESVLAGCKFLGSGSGSDGRNSSCEKIGCNPACFELFAAS
jgi:hypothetical protein